MNVLYKWVKQVTERGRGQERNYLFAPVGAGLSKG